MIAVVWQKKIQFWEKASMLSMLNQTKLNCISFSPPNLTYYLQAQKIVAISVQNTFFLYWSNSFIPVDVTDISCCVLLSTKIELLPTEVTLLSLFLSLLCLDVVWNVNFSSTNSLYLESVLPLLEHLWISYW